MTPFNTITPFEVTSPGIMLTALIMALFSHFFPTYCQTPLSIFISTTSDQRAKFEEMYTQYLKLTEEAATLDGNTSLFAQYSLLKRQIVKIEIQLEKFPSMYYKWYSRKYNVIATPLKHNTNTNSDESTNQRMSPDKLQQLSGSMGDMLTDKIIGFFPTMITFVIYLLILIRFGWNYTIFETGDYDHLFDDIIDVTTVHNTYLYTLLTYIFWLLPGAFLNTLTVTASTFFGLYWLFGMMLTQIIPQK